MATAQVVETSVTNNSLSEDYLHPDNHTRQTTETPGFKPLTNNQQQLFSRAWLCNQSMLKDLGWPTLEARRKVARLSMFQRIYYSGIDLNKYLYLTPVTRTRRNQLPSQVLPKTPPFQL